MNLDQITPLLLTYNEGANLARTLGQLSWASRIILVDSGSSDDTLNIAKQFAQVEVLSRDFDDFASQRNFGLSQVATPWALSLDADHQLSEAGLKEISALEPDGYQAFSAPFDFWVWGQRVRCAILPPRPVLLQVASCRYQADGHAEKLLLDGRCGQLSQPVAHDDRKPLSRWVSAQDRYAQQEAAKLRRATNLSRADGVRLKPWLAPLAVLAYVLVLRGGIFEGRRGWFYAYQRLLAELNLALHLMQNEADETVGETRND